MKGDSIGMKSRPPRGRKKSGGVGRSALFALCFTLAVALCMGCITKGPRLRKNEPEAPAPSVSPRASAELDAVCEAVLSSQNDEELARLLQGDLGDGEYIDDLYVQRGEASWYGPGFHGRTTANGEKYDMNAMTAAHRTLPFGTLVKVTNVANGKSVVVRINDRGPYCGDRIIDLSKAAAQAIGMLKTGTAEVRIIEVGYEP